jgi:hypothetical protein
MPSGTVLSGFAGSASSSTAQRPLFLRCAVKHGGRTRLTMRCQRAYFIVAYCALGFSPRPGRLTKSVVSLVVSDEGYNAVALSLCTTETV